MDLINVTLAPVENSGVLPTWSTTPSFNHQEKATDEIVKYELNTIENLKKAKKNLSRSLAIKRNTIDDQNVEVNLNPGLYLEIKKKTDEIMKGMTHTNDEVGIKLKITNTRRSVTKVKKSNPQTIFWFDVTDIRTNQTFRCVQKMYHTTQSIHFQGGNKIGNVSVTSLVADLMEKLWEEYKQEKGLAIEANNEAIKNMNIEEMENATKPKKKETKEKHNCDKCEYKSIHEYQITRHRYLAHQIKIEIEKPSLRRRKRTKVEVKENKSEMIKVQEKEENDASIVSINSTESSPKSKRTKTVEKKVTFETKLTEPLTSNSPSLNQNLMVGSQREVEDEISKVVENMEQTLKEKDVELKSMRDKIEQMDQELKKTHVHLVKANETIEKNKTETDLLKVEYESTFKAADKFYKENQHLLSDRTKVVANNAMLTRKTEQLEETLKVTEDILKAYEDGEESEDEDEEEEEEEDDDAMEYEEAGSKMEETGRRTNTCEKCNKQFQSPEEMRRHERDHTKVSKVVLKCHHCLFTSNDGEKLINHMSNKHYAQTCLTCKKRFTTMDNLVEHALKEHSKKVTPKDKCQECGMEFDKLDNLVHHIIREHSLTGHGEQASSAGVQLDQIWPYSDSTMKCFDCGLLVGDIQKHKRDRHFKQKICHNFQNGHCKFPDHVCLFIHQYQDNFQSQSSQSNQSPSNIPCRNGPWCIYFNQNRCKFFHSNHHATQTNQERTTSTNTSETTMNSILQRLKNIELKVPDLKSSLDFPQWKDTSKKM